MNPNKPIKKIDRIAEYLVCFMSGLITGAITIYILSWKLGILLDPRLDYFFKK